MKWIERFGTNNICHTEFSKRIFDVLQGWNYGATGDYRIHYPVVIDLARQVY